MKIELTNQNSDQLQYLIRRSEAFFNLRSVASHIAFLEDWESFLKKETLGFNLEESFMKYSNLERYVQDLINLFKDFRLVVFIGAAQRERELLISIQAYLDALEACSVQDVLQECMLISLQGIPQWDTELADIFHNLTSLLSTTEKLVELEYAKEEEWF